MNRGTYKPPIGSISQIVSPANLRKRDLKCHAVLLSRIPTCLSQLGNITRSLTETTNFLCSRMVSIRTPAEFDQDEESEQDEAASPQSLQDVPDFVVAAARRWGSRHSSGLERDLCLSLEPPPEEFLKIWSNDFLIELVKGTLESKLVLCKPSMWE